MSDPLGTAAVVAPWAAAVGALVYGFFKSRRADDAAEAKAAALAAKVAADAAAVAATKATNKLIELDGKVYALAKSVDGGFSELLKQTKENYLAKGEKIGHVKGVADERAAAAANGDAAKSGGRRDADT